MSITNEIGRINTALDAVEDGKEAIADALTAKGVDTMPDASFDTLATNIGLIVSGSASSQNIVVDERVSVTAGMYNYANCFFEVTIPEYAVNKKYFFIVEAGEDVDRSTASSSAPVLEIIIGFFSGTVIRNAMKFLIASFRNQGSATALSNNVVNTNADTNFKNGLFKLFSYSSNNYTRYGTGTYRLRIYEV